MTRYFWLIIATAMASLSINADHEIVIVHTNDIHARVLGVKENDAMCLNTELETDECFGGFDRIFAQVKHERSLHEGLLVLDAGDQFQGSLFHHFYHGLVSAQLMNQIGYDAMAVGNHEFDDGSKALANFIDASHFPLLSTNIDASRSPELKNKIRPYVIIKRAGLRIGVLGYTTEDTPHLSRPSADIKFLPIIESVKKTVAELKRAKVDVIIALSHAGLNKDIEVAKKVSGIAAIIAGHSNSLLSNREPDADGPSPLVITAPNKKPVLLVSAFAYGKFLGKLRFSFDKQGYPLSFEAEPIKLDKQIAREPQMKAEILKFYEPILAFENQVVGEVPVAIDGQSCRFEECMLGNVISDAMLNFGEKFGIDIALMNAGGIRASLDRGQINQAELNNVLPFDKTLVLFKLSGAVIKDIIEHGLAFAEDKKNDNTGRFLQVAGMKYIFDSSRPKGQRVEKILVKNAHNDFEELDEKRLYGVITNSFLAEGGDNYTFFKGPEHFAVGLELKDLLKDYLKTPLSQLPKKDGRIKNLASKAAVTKTKAFPIGALVHFAPSHSM